MTPHYRSNGKALSTIVGLDGRNALDVGCGKGELVSYMSKKGAKAVGLECNPLQIAAAKAERPDIDLREGVGEDMPFDDASFDLVVFMFSLHHVPQNAMSAALLEAARVLRPGGTLYVAEPLCAGSGFELHKPVDDETVVRGAALEALHSVPGTALAAVEETVYETSYHYGNFDDFREETCRIDPDRTASFDAQESALRSLFDELGVAEEKGIRFDQPVRVNLFTKPAGEA
ncbi:MAG: class I SAM-dependent methyltransferase [Rhodospirillales bacterium]